MEGPKQESALQSLQAKNAEQVDRDGSEPNFRGQKVSLREGGKNQHDDTQAQTQQARKGEKEEDGGKGKKKRKTTRRKRKKKVPVLNEQNE